MLFAYTFCTLTFFSMMRSIIISLGCIKFDFTVTLTSRNGREQSRNHWRITWLNTSIMIVTTPKITVQLLNFGPIKRNMRPELYMTRIALLGLARTSPTQYTTYTSARPKGHFSFFFLLFCFGFSIVLSVVASRRSLQKATPGVCTVYVV